MATVDLSQFHQTFFDESLEGLDVMEDALLALEHGAQAHGVQDPGAGDPELVNAIFRAAHSIKGGAATFGFGDVAAFTHVLESLLDEVRGGRRAADAEIIELLLQSVDCMRGMLARSRNGGAVADAASEALRGRFVAMLGKPARAPAAAVAQKQLPVDGWRIHFRPHPNLLRSGNDPLRMFRELAQHGTLIVKQVQLLQQPPAAFAELDPTAAMLGWELELHGDNIQRSHVDAVFDWVEGDCDLEIELLHDRRATAQAAAPAAQDAGTHDAGSIRVAITKVDALINMVGELVITQSMLGDIGENFSISRLKQLREGLAQLDRTTRELQDSVMRIRMLPIAAVFNRFPRMVRDLEHRLGKRVRLELHGESTEVDKTVLEKIGDPLVHLVRNAIDHGLEKPGERVAAGKPEVGVLRLEARHEGGNVVVEVVDDGGGLRRGPIIQKAIERGLVSPGQELGDEEVAELIFQAGFSTNGEATDLSGRGVGMDVVRRNVSDLGGSVRVRSREGHGSAFTIVLPLTLAIIEGLVTELGGERYIVPLVSIVESLQLKAQDVRHVGGGGELFHFRNDWLPLMRLRDVFGCANAVTGVEQGIVIVVEAGGRRGGLLVDSLIGQQQTVIKSLEAHYRRVEGISGATIASDGSVALIVDVDGVVRASARRRAA
ncbi:MAG TPA: chemotaxis protein CheA [Rhodanobacteraceae bacterium]|nr:chemotaxis protein CheA [Rhodanobacteraceae bacterium]